MSAFEQQQGITTRHLLAINISSQIKGAWSHARLFSWNRAYRARVSPSNEAKHVRAQRRELRSPRWRWKQTNHSQQGCVSMTKVKVGVVAMFLLFAFSTAFAASNSTSLNLGTAATVAGKQLQPGSYKVTWTGSGDNLTVTIKGNHTEITAPAKAEKNDAPMAGTSYVTNKDGELSEIRPGGKNTSLKFTQTQASNATNSSSTSN